ncbi:MAG: hypothetical protein ACSHYA_06760 [Opitutaceae bacterium]
MKRISILLLPLAFTVMNALGAKREYTEEQLDDLISMLAQIKEKQQLQQKERKAKITESSKGGVPDPLIQYIHHKSKNADLSVKLDSYKGEMVLDIIRYEHVSPLDAFALEYIPMSAKEISKFIKGKNIKSGSVVCEAINAFSFKIDPREVLEIFQEAGFEKILIYEGWSAQGASSVKIEWNLPLKYNTQQVE